PKGETIIVTSAENSGPGTLRQGLLDANIGDTITFDPEVFPPDVSVTIRLTSPLPELDQGYLTIDASNAGVILDGSTIDPPYANGLMISSIGNTIQGMQIVGFPQMGIIMSGAAQKNTIGGNRDIGSGPLGQGNLISSNGEKGIVLSGHGTSYNFIIGNFIGVDVSGTHALGNRGGGLLINGAKFNQVSNNIVSGNDGTGMEICCTGTINNTISGNLIGTDISGEAGLGNGGNGIELQGGASQNIIGPDNIIA
ncbi:MAG: right-handed parallel beta-helix repeat-containing protein, partial [Anaerolineaceae bacterium]|nr:right-handed parallel beta-helix repeat-containing protein [Anaerolineaceae bacterium]